MSCGCANRKQRLWCLLSAPGETASSVTVNLANADTWPTRPSGQPFGSSYARILPFVGEGAWVVGIRGVGLPDQDPPAVAAVAVNLAAGGEVIAEAVPVSWTADTYFDAPLNASRLTVSSWSTSGVQYPLGGIAVLVELPVGCGQPLHGDAQGPAGRWLGGR